MSSAGGVAETRPCPMPLRRRAVLLALALGTWQTGGVHDVVRHLDEALAGQDWSLADAANSVLSTQRVLHEPLQHPGCGTTTSMSSARGIGSGAGEPHR